MPRGKKRPQRRKQINITAMECGLRKYMREHPLYGPDFRRQENINSLFKSSPRRFRKEGSYISR